MKPNLENKNKLLIIINEKKGNERNSPSISFQTLPKDEPNLKNKKLLL